MPHPWLKPAVLVGSLAPLASIAWRTSHGGLGADPVAQVLNELGLVALVFLVASLACTPLKAFLGWTWPIRLRRMLGLLAFAYAILHVATYFAVDHPRWSQATERRIGELSRRPTLPFNGYADEVAHLYGSMDLRRYF